MEKSLPKEYEAKKINLKSLNVGGFAWKKIYFIFSILKRPDFAVLGGDVLLYKDGK